MLDGVGRDGGLRRKSDILVSACLIIRDEEEFLEDCLRSMVGFAGEIIINDTGSRDRSIEIAKSFGAIVFEEPFCGDFSHHRNLTIDRASGDWMFFIDGDEQVVDRGAGGVGSTWPRDRARYPGHSVRGVDRRCESVSEER